MKYLGLDYGSKRIGVAVSNAEGTIAFPRKTIDNDAKTLDALTTFISGEKIDAIVVGDTRTLSGAANSVTKEAEDFAAQLREAASLPLFFGREAGSSVAVSESSRASHDDAAAAAFILQRFLDMRGIGVE